MGETSRFSDKKKKKTSLIKKARGLSKIAKLLGIREEEIGKN